LNIKLATDILDAAIGSNLCYCTNLSDSLTPPEPPNDLANRLTNIMLEVVSEDTMHFITVLYCLTKNKRNKK